MDIKDLPSLQQKAITRLADRIDRLLETSIQVHTGIGLTKEQSNQVVGIVLFNILVDRTLEHHGLLNDKHQLQYFQDKLDEALTSIVEQLKNAPSSN